MSVNTTTMVAIARSSDTIYRIGQTTLNINPEVVGSIPAKTQKKKMRTQIYMDLRYIDPQARVLNYFYK